MRSINIKQLKMPTFVKSKIKLTIGILVSNQIKYIRRVMDSLKPLLDAIPSELIVVDTVGPEKSDGSLAIAKEYTEKVYHFDWIEDFSAARNVTLEHASGEWYLFIDDDEVFDDVTELINFFRSGECDKYNYGMMFVANYTTTDRYQKDVVGRLIRRTEKTRFVGIIHEHFNEAYGPSKNFNVFLHHYGYLYVTRAQMEAKNQRNLKLLEKDYALNGPSVRLCAQYVQQLLVLNPEEALAKCSEFLELLEGDQEMKRPIGQWLIVSKIRAIFLWANIENVLECEKDLLDRFVITEMGKLVIAQRVAIAACNAEKYELVADRVKVYFNLRDWLLTHDMERQEQIVLDFPAFMSGAHLYEVLKAGILAECQLGDYKRAYSYFEMLDFEYCDDYSEISFIADEMFLGLKDHERACKWYRQIYRDELIDRPELHKYLPLAARVCMEEKD